jgi:hypothetical protein
MACSTTRVDGDLLIAGLIIEPAQRVTFRPMDGAGVDLDIYALDAAPAISPTPGSSAKRNAAPNCSSSTRTVSSSAR